MLSEYAPSATKTPADNLVGKQWWREKDDDAAALMLAKAGRIAKEQEAYREDWRLYGSIYSGRHLSSLYDFDPGTASSMSFDSFGHRINWNLIQCATDTAEARLAKARTRPRIQTFGGDWKLHKRAEKMGLWLDGLFHEQKYYQQVARPCFKDAALFSLGMPKVVGTREGIVIDRALPFEILIDKAEGMNRRPKTGYQCAILPRDAVEEAFGRTEELKEMIRKAPNAPDSDSRGDVIELVEGWHCGNDARHLVALAGTRDVLLDEPWKLKRLPLGRYVYGELPVGWPGLGIAERLIGHQLQILRMLKDIQMHLRRNAGGRWWNPIGSQVTPGDLMNIQGGVVTGTQKPEPLVVPFMPKEVYEQLERQWRHGFETIGLSEQSVTGMKPSGVNSGKAQREVRDTEQERFSIPAQAFDEMTVDVTELAIATAREAFRGNKAAMVRAPGTRIIEQIKWSDVDMAEESFIVRTGAANLLPTTPAARLEAIQEMEAKGTISREAAAALMDMPDIEGAVNPGAAQYEEACRAVGRLLDTGEYEAPDEVLQPDLAIAISEALYLRAKGNGAPREELGLVLRFRDDCKQRLREMAQQVAASMPQGPAPGGPPPGPPPMAPAMMGAAPMPGAMAA